MIEQLATWIGYGVMGLAGLAFFFGLLYEVVTWWEWNVLAKKCKFDGKGNIVRS